MPTRRSAKPTHRQTDAEIKQIVEYGELVDVGGTGGSRVQRSSVRLIRGRQAALRDYNLLVAERPIGKAGDRAGADFVDGFNFVRVGVEGGWTPEEEFDFSATVRGGSTAFHDGANAERNFYNSYLTLMGQRGHEIEKPPSISNAERATAVQYAKAYGVKLPSLKDG